MHSKSHHRHEAAATKSGAVKTGSPANVGLDSSDPETGSSFPGNVLKSINWTRDNSFAPVDKDKVTSKWIHRSKTWRKPPSQRTIFQQCLPAILGLIEEYLTSRALPNHITMVLLWGLFGTRAGLQSRRLV